MMAAGSPLLALALAAAAAASPAAEPAAPPPVEPALAGDDACWAEDGARAEGACSLELRQLRASSRVTLAVDAPPAPSDDDVRKVFDDFKLKFGKKYGGKEENERRFGIFKDNLAFVEAENAKGHPYKLGINELADKTIDMLTAKASAPEDDGATEEPEGGNASAGVALGAGTMPTSLDWRRKGAITPVLNQDEYLGGGYSGCGSCWSFATTGAISAAWYIATGSLVLLSQQQFIDCTKGSCANGGIAGQAMTYAQSHALCTRQSYPYKAMDTGTCRESDCLAVLPAGSVRAVHKVPFARYYWDFDEKWVLQRLQIQPVAIAIYANHYFQMYESGIFDGPCDVPFHHTNHAVQFVGYGSESGQAYWLLKNSWGYSWGLDGYMHLLRAPGRNQGGVCESLTRVRYPVVSTEPTTTTTTTTTTKTAASTTGFHRIVNSPGCVCSWIPRDDCSEQTDCATSCRKANPWGPCGAPHRIVNKPNCDCSWIPRDDCSSDSHCATSCREANPWGPCGAL